MNTLSLPIPSLHADAEEAELTPEEQAAEAKKQRIAFHRAHVRNGPAKFAHQSSGQVRRESKRALARGTRKARRAQIRDYFARERKAAVLGAHLRAVGVLDYSGSGKVVHDQAVRSLVWLVERFADGEDGQVLTLDSRTVSAALTNALNTWQKLVGMPPSPLPPGYVLPVSLSA